MLSQAQPAGLRVDGVVLAAGLARRFGAEKLLAPLGGKPLGWWAVEAALASDLATIVLVTRPELASELAPQADPRLRIVLNSRPEEGQSLSLRLGLAALDQESSHALFLLADQPLVGPALIDRFIRIAVQGAELAAIRPGEAFKPPALFGRKYFKELAALSGDQGGRTLLDRYANRVAVVEIEAEIEAADADSPADLVRLKKEIEGE